jgi:hypothetical protein
VVTGIILTVVVLLVLLIVFSNPGTVSNVRIHGTPQSNPNGTVTASWSWQAGLTTTVVTPTFEVSVYTISNCNQLAWLRANPAQQANPDLSGQLPLYSRFTTSSLSAVIGSTGGTGGAGSIVDSQFPLFHGQGLLVTVRAPGWFLWNSNVASAVHYPVCLVPISAQQLQTYDASDMTGLCRASGALNFAVGQDLQQAFATQNWNYGLQACTGTLCPTPGQGPQVAAAQFQPQPSEQQAVGYTFGAPYWFSSSVSPPTGGWTWQPSPNTNGAQVLACRSGGITGLSSSYFVSPLGLAGYQQAAAAIMQTTSYQQLLQFYAAASSNGGNGSTAAQDLAARYCYQELPGCAGFNLVPSDPNVNPGDTPVAQFVCSSNPTTLQRVPASQSTFYSISNLEACTP